jgi:predicted exporter
LHLDLRDEMTSTMAAFPAEGFSRPVFGIAVMGALHWASLRRVPAVMAPVMVGVTGPVLLVLIVGQVLTLLHLVGALLVAGITIDYGLFFSWQREHHVESRLTALAALVCALTTATTFGILALSKISALQAVGTTVFFGVSLGFLAARLTASRPKGHDAQVHAQGAEARY